MLISTCDLGTSIWVAQEAGKTNTTPTFYTLVFFWTEEVMNNLSVALGFCALACYGARCSPQPPSRAGADGRR